MQLTSTAFNRGDSIPEQFTGVADNFSPPLLWSELPTGTVSLALLLEDPDAPEKAEIDHPVVHWVVFNVDPAAGMIPEGLPHEWKITSPIACEQGLNSHGRNGYSGPMPPEGDGAHRYVFRLFALSKKLELPARARKEELLDGMRGSVLGTAELIAFFERPERQQSLPESA
jgi:Raf kinase inhibitor-like YbhB/YbcL family protein